MVETQRHTTTRVDSPTIESRDRQKLMSFLNARKSNSSWGQSNEKMSKSIHFVARHTHKTVLFEADTNCWWKFKNKSCETYMDSGDEKRQHEEIEIRVCEDPFHFVRVLLREPCM